MTDLTDSVRSAEAEFDRYAADYDGGMTHPLKRCLGRTAEDYIAVKVAWLLRDLARHPVATSHGANGPLRILDLGCGVGTFLQLLQQSGLRAQLHGCDVSVGMLEEGERRWGGSPKPELDRVVDGTLPYDDGSFDLVISCCVLHHVPAGQRRTVLREAARALAPHGRICVFEHNPWNPVTRWVVRRTAIDAEAMLLSAAETRAALRDAGLDVVSTAFLMFFPPRWPSVRRVEDYLRWCPSGAQYVVSATKARTSES